jgi:hypothetical protein
MKFQTFCACFPVPAHEKHVEIKNLIDTYLLTITAGYCFDRKMNFWQAIFFVMILR